MTRSKVNLTAAASSGVPSWKRTPLRSLNVHVSPSDDVVQDSASPGTTSVLSSGLATSVSKISAVTRSVWSPSAWPGSSPGGSASIPTTTTSRGACAQAVVVNSTTASSVVASGANLDMCSLSYFTFVTGWSGWAGLGTR